MSAWDSTAGTHRLWHIDFIDQTWKQEVWFVYVRTCWDKQKRGMCICVVLRWMESSGRLTKCSSNCCSYMDTSLCICMGKVWLGGTPRLSCVHVSCIQYLVEYIEQWIPSKAQYYSDYIMWVWLPRYHQVCWGKWTKFGDFKSPMQACEINRSRVPSPVYGQR